MRETLIELLDSDAVIEASREGRAASRQEFGLLAAHKMQPTVSVSMLLMKAGVINRTYATMQDLEAQLASSMCQVITDDDDLQVGDIIFGPVAVYIVTEVNEGRIRVYSGKSFFLTFGIEKDWRAYRLPSILDRPPSDQIAKDFFNALAYLYDHVADLHMSEEEKSQVMYHLNGIRYTPRLKDLKR